MFQCGVCKSGYDRSDHLIRHIRSHTRQRPFVCTVCTKGFARQDLLKRHVGTHGSDGSTGSTRESFNLAHSGQQSQRVHQACRACAAKKLKCSEQKPCERCAEKNIHCEFEPLPELPNQGGTSQSIAESHSPERLANSIDQNQQTVSDTSSFETNLQGNNGISSQDNFMQDILYDTLNIPDIGDFIQQDCESTLGDLDFSFLDDMNSPRSPPPPPLVSQSPISTTVSQPSTVGFGAEAFRKSDVHNEWEPGTEDHHRQEYPNLIMPQKLRPEDIRRSFEVSSMSHRRMPSLMRDRVLAMILRSSCGSATERILKSFPSLEVLNDLIQLAFVHMKEHQVIQFIHLPSVDLDDQRAEFLGSLIAYGSVSSPSQTVRKFGYALQEIVRASILRLVEEHHATLRESRVCQAFYIQLHLAFYSCVSRKIEMAEGYSMLGATILRRGKMLSKDAYVSPEEFLDIPALSLHQKWLRWAEKETQKRLVYFAMTLDAHTSITRRTKVLFSYAEMKTPLPSHGKLWEAETASSWFDILQQDVQVRLQQPPSLCKILRQPQLSAVQLSITDMTPAAIIFFAGFWSLILEYQQMNAILPGAQSSNDFVLNSRYAELISNLDSFKFNLVNLQVDCPEVLIAQELMSLHLNVPFYQLSDYAGMGTEEDAHSAMPYAHRWFESPKSRIALWHSGQIFRAARLLKPKKLADIHVLALYHATLTLWVWSLLQKAQGSGIISNGDRVVLDGEESPMMLRFFKSYPAMPGLTSEHGTFLQLDDPVMAPDLANAILEANWNLEPMPRTTEEVSRMLQEFSSICRRKFARSTSDIP
ncbi:hypothetical protein BU16DRAFT_496007 [Lophium mytilinum]|uniref:Uncharacterized protein n=1 Tax=Lophium mytilinum TaxID=390894 RepID=A0A6A6QB01_9PEZI|nr:hypothetical protein BU16DRAFT_496007 [Lophium mytilinum]